MADSPPRRHSSGSGSGRRGSIYRSSQVFNRLDSRNYALPLGVPEKSTQIEQQEELVKNLNTYYIQCFRAARYTYAAVLYYLDALYRWVFFIKKT